MYMYAVELTWIFFDVDDDMYLYGFHSHVVGYTNI